MKATLIAIYALATRFGGPGLLVVGLLDSSFLFIPLGNDLLMLGLTASHHEKFLYYAVMAAAGSTAGCFLTDLLARKGGEEGLKKLLPPKRLEYVKKRIGNNAGWTLALASIMPPPFPFTPFVAGAAAFQYPRKKLLPIIAATRFGRFVGVGLLGVYFGKHILRIAESPWVQYPLIGIVILAVAGSAISVYGWIKRSRGAASKSPAGAPAAA